MRPPRACSRTLCPHNVPCPTHSGAADRARGSSWSRGYDAAHHAWRMAVLDRDPMCRGCEWAPSTHAEHVHPWQQGGEKLALENGQGNCASCANFKSRMEQRDPQFGLRLRLAGQAIGQPAPKGWRKMRAFGGVA